MSADNQPPDLEAYHRSIAEELCALKSRIRNLVPHWPTDGAQKEAILRSVLRRHLPESYLVGRGFIVTKGKASTEIDMLIVDARLPTLFKDGDLLIVTPHAVRAIVEVKTKLKGPQAIKKVVSKLADNARLCSGIGSHGKLWTGLFVFEGNGDDARHKQILQGAKESWAQREPKMPVKAVSWGCRTFILFWGDGENVWRSYDLEDLAPSYFIGNLLLALGGWSVADGGYAWFPLREGKEQRKRFEIGFGDAEPKRCP